MNFLKVIKKPEIQQNYMQDSRFFWVSADQRWISKKGKFFTLRPHQISLIPCKNQDVAIVNKYIF